MNAEQVSRSPLHGLWALTARDLKKWVNTPVLLLMSFIQPIVWMGLFGKAMNINAIFTTGIPTNLPPQAKELVNDLSKQIFVGTFGTADYFSFMSVGILSTVILFTSMFSGMSIVWDRRLGFLDKVLTTPVARGAVIMAKVLASVLRSLTQATIVLAVAIALGLQLGASFTPLNILGIYAALFLLSLGLSSIFVMIAIRSTSWESQMATMNLLNLPLMFASNALFPVAMMPSWLQGLARVNPITYGTDATRQLLLYDTNLQQLSFDFIYLAGFAATFCTIGVILSWRYLSR